MDREEGRAQDRRAVNREILEQVGFVRALARALVEDPHLAEDLAQEACLKALQSPPRDPGALRGWFARVLRNLAFKNFRARDRRTRREKRAARPEAGSEDPVLLEEKKEILRRVSQAVLDLPRAYQEAVFLRFYEGLSQKDAAQRLGIPLETFRTRQKRALEKLRTRLDRECPGGRKAWLTAILPLAAGKGPHPARISPSLSFPGGILVSTAGKTLLFAGLPALLLLGLSFLVFGGRTGPVPPAEKKKPLLAATHPLPGKPPASSPKRKDLAAFRVQGRVTDPTGRPLEGIRISGLWLEKGHIHKTRTRTAQDGTYALIFPSAVNAWIRLFSRTWGTSTLEGMTRRVRVPARGVDFRLFPRPSAVLVVRIQDRRTGVFLSSFKYTLVLRRPVLSPLGEVGMGDTPVEANQTAQGPVLKKVLLLPPGVRTAQVQVVTHWARRWVELEAGKTTEVTLQAEVKALEGVVTDTEGRPLEGAIVFCGSPMLLRGNEPFKPLDPRRIGRIQGVVKTGSDGRFRLVAAGPLVTAWRPGYSPVTRTIGDAARLVLPGLGSIEGVLLDERGEPRPGVSLLLDRDRQTRTGRRGRFRFEEVEAGVRGISLPGKELGGGRRESPGKYWGVLVKPGAPTKVTLGPGIETVEVHILSSGGKPFLAPMKGYLVGLDRTFTFPLSFTAREGTFMVHRILPGRYYLLSKEGRGLLEIRGPKAQVRLGGADLTVLAKPTLTLGLYPEKAHELLRLTCLRAARFFRSRAKGDGRLLFKGLPPGSYLLSTPNETRRRRVEVKGSGTLVDCRDW